MDSAVTTTTTTTTTSSGFSSYYANNKTMFIDEYQKLSYEIFRYSSFLNNYFPENILVDCPSDQLSRWTANTNSKPQYLTLKLVRPAIVKRIKFGKFEKNHVCNLTKFRVYGGLQEDHLLLLLEGGLKNDNIPEVFNLHCRTEDNSGYLPILYIKIEPLLSWGPSFHFSIWYVELHGQDDVMLVGPYLKSYNMLREIEIVKLCLKHFRQQGYDAAYKALQEQTQVQLEHPHITKLHNCLVENGDFRETEEIIKHFLDEGLADQYLNRQDYKHNWSLKATVGDIQPGNRGGHQLVMNTKHTLIYLYGGWDGFQDLSDLWVYDIEKNFWTMLCEQSEKCNGPTPRSCHKMVYDPISENIFMIGRYLDNSIRTTEYIKSDFYLYDTRVNSWLQICDDTSQVGGPHLVYDHQMCIDVDKHTIYMFGGKVLTPRSVTACASNETEYSGLFSYHIGTNTWTQILVDCHHPKASIADVPSIKSRITHCMVFHTKHRKLYVYGGQRGKEEIDDFFSYDLDTQVITILNRGNHMLSRPNEPNESRNEPSPGCTLRATIDCDRDEIYMFSSLSKQKDRRDVQQTDPSNSFWVYSLRTNSWSHIYTRRLSYDVTTITANSSDTLISLEPCPRYAHQLVYDDKAKVHYLFGGNPGKPKSPQIRLDDFWILTLEKPKREELLNQCRFLIRKLCYEEMARTDALKAMQYLREKIGEVVDTNNKIQLKNFHKLATLLFRIDDDSQTLEGTTTAMPTSTAPLQPILGGITRRKDCDEDAAIDTDRHWAPGSPPSDDSMPEELSLESSESSTSSTTTTLSSTLSQSISSMSYDVVSGRIVNKNQKKYDAGAGGAATADNLIDICNYKKRPRHDDMNSITKNQRLMAKRASLFNKLVQILPANMVPPKQNLSDFVSL